MQLNNKYSFISRILLVFLFFTLMLTGCAFWGTSEESEMSQSSANQPYYPKDFREILIPDGLSMNRDNSMYVKTSSFGGGILNFEGRLEVNSLIEFFQNSMPKNGWQLSGSVKSKKSLLIFTKPEKVCMITIAENSFNFNTEVYVYISEKISQANMPFTGTVEESLN